MSKLIVKRLQSATRSASQPRELSEFGERLGLLSLLTYRQPYEGLFLGFHLSKIEYKNSIISLFEFLSATSIVVAPLNFRNRLKSMLFNFS